MKAASIILFSFLVIFLSVNSTVLAQEKERTEEETVETKAKVSEKSRGADENIIQENFVNDEENLPDAPAEKGGEKSRGANFYTKVIVNNWTGYYINIYADGYLKGSVAPWSDGHFWEYGSKVKLYGKAPLKGGKYKFWGPQVHNISNSSTFNWKLTY